MAKVIMVKNDGENHDKKLLFYNEHFVNKKTAKNVIKCLYFEYLH